MSQREPMGGPAKKTPAGFFPRSFSAPLDEEIPHPNSPGTHERGGPEASSANLGTSRKIIRGDGSAKF